jgi:hypothetical protein
VPAELQPTELARLVDFAERPRVDDWSLRAALVRYAQREPQRVSTILELVRRIDFALKPQAKTLEKEGPTIWAGIGAGSTDALVELLRTTQELDGLGDRLATWAVDRDGDPPDDVVDAVTARVARQLDDQGVPREQRERPPPGARRREQQAADSERG